MTGRTLLTVGVFAVGVVAWGQDVRPIGLSIRAGQFRPQGQAARSLGKIWSVGGLDLNLKTLKSGRNGSSLTVSVDFATKGDFQTIPVCINHVSRNDEWYYFGGAGVSFAGVPRIISGISEKSDSIELAYQFGVGYDFQKGKSPLFAEIKYLGNGEDRLSAFGIYVGVRL